MGVRTELSLLQSYKVRTRLYKCKQGLQINVYQPQNVSCHVWDAYRCKQTATQLKLSDTNSQAWTQEGRERPSIKDYRSRGRSGGDERRLGMQAQQLSITGIQYMHTIDVKESADLQPFDS